MFILIQAPFVVFFHSSRINFLNNKCKPDQENNFNGAEFLASRDNAVNLYRNMTYCSGILLNRLLNNRVRFS